jgi:hypothetical protein
MAIGYFHLMKEILGRMTNVVLRETTSFVLFLCNNLLEKTLISNPTIYNIRATIYNSTTARKRSLTG